MDTAVAMIFVVKKIWSIDSAAGKALAKSIVWTFGNKLFDVVPDISIGLIINFAILKERSFLVHIGFPNSFMTIYVVIGVIFIAFLVSNGAQFFISLELGNAAKILHHQLKLALCRSIVFRTGSHETSAEEQHHKNRDIEIIEFFIQRTYEDFLKLIFSSLIIGVILVSIVPQFLLYALLPLPPILYLANVLYRKISPYHDTIRQATKNLQHDFDELITCLPTIKDFAIEARAFGKVEARASELYQIRDTSNVVMSLLMPSTRIMIQIASLAIVFHGIVLVWQHEITIGAFLAAIFLSRKFLLPFSSLGMLVNSYRKGTKALKEIDLATLTPVSMDGRAHLIHKNPPSIVVRDLSFSFGDKIIFDKLNCEFSAGTINVIKGPTGRGKTTLCRLLLRDYEHESGTICYGTTQIDSYTRSDWRTNITMVSQAPQLFMGSIMQNITLFSPELDRDRFERAIEASLMTQFIGRFPHGVDAVVGSNNIKLSLGQTQSLALARALYCETKILLLDEPTTGFDDDREQLFVDMLKQIVKERIVIITSHSQKIINAADHVVEL